MNLTKHHGKHSFNHGYYEILIILFVA